jgi:hypothetical protein
MNDLKNKKILKPELLHPLTEFELMVNLGAVRIIRDILRQERDNQSQTTVDMDEQL